MSADERDRERDEQEQQEIEISDKRHSREITAESEREESAVEPEAEPAPEVPAEPVGVVEFEPPKKREQAAPAEKEPPVDAEQESAQEASVRMLFEAGIIPYLHGQLQLLLSFALIYMGRQPNPATGLVSADLEQARLVIDLFLFIVERTGQHMPPEDRANLVNVASSLKMEFAQVAQDAPAAVPAGSDEAES